MDAPDFPLYPNGIGLSAPEHNRRQRELLDQVNQLHSTGIHVDIDLPQICVIGAQSSGKSSLIEAIAGITLPRDAGTCTRCPIECRLARSIATWSCRVSLQFFWDASGQLLPQARNEPFGNPITDKSLVEDRIRRAQRAILNPRTPSEHFLTGRETAPDEYDFSKNRILLQISGPDVADLSFCDLPGLIASVSGGRAVDNIDLVRDLVASYIEKPSCVILVSVACETDFENQSAHRLAKEFDPDGERTIGVLTKPDRIPLGEEDHWIRFIKNIQEPLKHNWFCVKQPSSLELSAGITWLGAREKENDFFSTRRGWFDLDPSYKRYLGTANLVGRLSSILSDLIEARMPHIQAEVDAAVSKTEDELGSLPPEPSPDPVLEVVGLLQRFVTELQEEVKGQPDLDGLIQTIRPHNEEFRKSIRGTVPYFLPLEEKYSDRKMEPFVFLYDEDDKDSDDSTHGPSTICIDEVFKRALGARSRELPGHVPFSVQLYYINQFHARWPAPATRLCRLVYDILNERVDRLVKKHFSTFGQGSLEQPVRLLLQDHLKACRDRGKEKIEWLLNLEKLPFTSNTFEFGFYQKNFLDHYRAARQTALTRPATQQAEAVARIGNRAGIVADVLSGLAKLGMRVREGDLSKLHPPDQMDIALPIMADVRAYFQVAYRRFVDNVPMAVDFELVQGLGRELFQVLSSGLGIYGADAQRNCREWTGEPPETSTRRAQLKKKLERLQEARFKFSCN